MHERVLSLSGVHNFRDYGGYASSHGGRVRRGVLWRSAHHAGASDEDLARIDRIGLASVVDLRGDSEREANPCRRGPGFTAQIFCQEGETAGLAPHLEAARDAMDAQSARQALINYYRLMPHRDNLLGMLRCYFIALSRTARPSLVHCVAGKDRTGFAVAMMQHVLGVHRDDITADYLLTNSAGNIEARIAEGARHVKARYGVADAATVRTIMGVDPAFLEASFEAIIDRHGSVDAYLEAVLEVDAARRERLRELYLEAGDQA